MTILFHLQLLILNCVFCAYLSNAVAVEQQPEINDQYENVTNVENITTVQENTTIGDITTVQVITTTEPNKVFVEVIKHVLQQTNESKKKEIMVIQTESLTTKICNIVIKPIVKFISIPKVNSVLKNIGTCVVNGAMELIIYYFPPPLIPLIATAAGMIIPFEPVVMLREKMPVTSYRRAFKKAMNSFLGTFDRFKLNDELDDPYMTRRFNRRFMTESSEKNKVDE